MDNPASTPLSVRFPSFRRLFTWRVLRRILIVLAWGATIVALFYGEENWRGRRAWNNYRRELEARGEPFDLKSFIPKPVPDEQNFAMTPLLAPLFDFEPGTQHRRDSNGWDRAMSDPPRHEAAASAIKRPEATVGDWSRGRKLDLVAWQRAYAQPTNPSTRQSINPIPDTPAGEREDRATAAAAVLEALRECDPMLEELRAASRRPYSRFNLRYDEENPAGILLPHLAVLKRWVTILQLRAAAELALGKTEPALEDIRFSFRLIDAVREEPTLISFRVRVSEVRLALQPIWEGMAEGRWSAGQLEAIQQALQRFDFLGDAKRGLQAECIGLGNGILEYLRRWPSQAHELVGLDEARAHPNATDLAAHVLAWGPRGWLYQEQVEYDRLFDRFILPPVDTVASRVRSDLSSSNRAALDGLLAGDALQLLKAHRVFSTVLLPSLPNIHIKAAEGQAWVDVAVVACALERYRLATNQYPEMLDALAPRFIEKLPHDVISGQPLKYRREEGGRFVLYSVGWNAKDDGGAYPPKRIERSERPFGKPNPDDGDWVWRYP